MIILAATRARQRVELTLTTPRDAVRVQLGPVVLLILACRRLTAHATRLIATTSATVGTQG